MHETTPCPGLASVSSLLSRPLTSNIQHLQHIPSSRYHTLLPSTLVYMTPTSPTSSHCCSITGDVGKRFCPLSLAAHHSYVLAQPCSSRYCLYIWSALRATPSPFTQSNHPPFLYFVSLPVSHLHRSTVLAKLLPILVTFPSTPAAPSSPYSVVTECI